VTWTRARAGAIVSTRKTVSTVNVTLGGKASNASPLIISDLISPLPFVLFLASSSLHFLPLINYLRPNTKVKLLHDQRNCRQRFHIQSTPFCRHFLRPSPTINNQQKILSPTK